MPREASILDKPSLGFTLDAAAVASDFAALLHISSIRIVFTGPIRFIMNRA